MIKFHTLIKGIIWESLGVVILFSYTLYTTNDLHSALGIGLGYPALRAIMFYPYERVCKWFRRRNQRVLTIECNCNKRG